MMPNSRQACLNSSPILVLYAILLLIGQYVYSLDLTDQELPVTAGKVSISEIGFRKYHEFSYQPLFVKVHGPILSIDSSIGFISSLQIFYTMFFWITLRQYSEKKEDQTESGAGQGVFAPLHNIGRGRLPSASQAPETSREISFGTSTAAAPTPYQSKVFESMVNFFQEVLIKYWIWVVATMLMIMSLSGSKVVRTF